MEKLVVWRGLLIGCPLLIISQIVDGLSSVRIRSKFVEHFFVLLLLLAMKMPTKASVDKSTSRTYVCHTQR